MLYCLYNISYLAKTKRLRYYLQKDFAINSICFTFVQVIYRLMNEHHPSVGILNIILAFVGAAASVALANIQITVSIIAGIMGILSAGFAIRYYWYKTEEVIKTKKDVD
jgi:hypothetical protein